MVGPSSSHTAGALRIANLARVLLKEEVKSATVKLHGSFGLTWKGHGSDKAILAGFMGLQTDDLRIKDAYTLAEERGLECKFIETTLKTAFHPNSLLIDVWGDTRHTKILASSIGGGLIILNKVDGVEIHYRGRYPTFVIVSGDIPGIGAHIMGHISSMGINIQSMRVNPRSKKRNNKFGDNMITVIALSDLIDDATMARIPELIEQIDEVDGVVETIFIDKLY